VIDNHGQGLVALVPVSDAERLAALDVGRTVPVPSANALVKLAELLGTARSIRPELQAIGIRHLAIFGSFARGDEHPRSDVDVMLQIDPNGTFDLFDLAGVRERLIALFGRDVDVVIRRSPDPPVDEILRDAVYAF